MMVLKRRKLIAELLLVLLFLVFLLLHPAAWGAESAAAAGTAYSPVEQIAKMIIGLLVVLVMIFVLAWLARNYGGFSPAQNAALKTVAGVAVGQKERVVLLQVGERQLLIGVAPGEVTLLHVIEKGEEVAAAEHSLPPFAEKLKRAMGRMEKS